MLSTMLKPLVNKGTAGNQMPIPSGGQKAMQPTGSSGGGSQLQAAPEYAI